MKKLAFNSFISLLACVVAVFLTSCADKDVEDRGYIAKFSDFSKIKPGISTKQDVINELGSPTTTALFGTETWYYIGKEQTKETFFEPDVKSYTGYEIAFNDAGVVSSINKKDQSSLKDRDIEDDYTKTSGNEITVWQQLFGNIGKFNPASRQNRGVSPNGRAGLPGGI